MALIQLNLNPTDRQLQQFGVIAAFALPALGWLWEGNQPVILALAAVGASLAFVGLLQPRRLRWPFVALTAVMLPIGLVVGEIVLLITYFAVVLPIAVVFRLLKRDRLRLKFDRHAATYWQPKPPPRGVASYFRQS